MLSKDGSASVMLCEEDHIRLQVRAAGQDLEGAYAKADQLDDALLDRLPIAFDERLGFLTAVPTNLGHRYAGHAGFASAGTGRSRAH